MYVKSLDGLSEVKESAGVKRSYKVDRCLPRGCFSSPALVLLLFKCAQDASVDLILLLGRSSANLTQHQRSQHCTMR